MAMLMDKCCDYLFLPRPWLNENAIPAQAPDGSRASNRHADPSLYLRGDAKIGPRTIHLPYWHKVVLIEILES
ncbi:MAG TPA: hypothetical protein VGQ99_15525 [Tepidisphaeraceae bacterium]|jgi:hypothetical protein|nr:hypothetical protein [Tepidisphaeraceae bacterium]